MRAILGVNCFSHDTSACLLVDGAVVAVAEQERFDRCKHSKAFPDDAIASCLDRAGLQISDVEAVAFAHRPVLDLVRGAADAVLRLSPKRLAVQGFVDGRLLAKERAFARRWGYGGKVLHVGHHEAHAASAFFPSPFEQAAVLTLDRGGDFLSTTLNVGQGNRLRLLGQVRNPHSLGEVYTALTWFLGFRPNSDEGKVMGLAPYGSDRLVPDARHFFRVQTDGRFRVDLRWFRYQREAGYVSRRFVETFGERREPESEITERDRDLAYAVQAVTEEAALRVASALRRISGVPRLCLAGGVALNSVMNTRLLREAGFEDVFVQPAASDAGNAIGAALWVWHQVLGHPRQWRMEHAYLGPAAGDGAAARAVDASGLPARTVGDAPAEAARLLADGKVVGWFQGDAEIGPRALGARSILADPRPAEMKDVVNARVKRREGFRPFAPSVLHERGAEYFVDYHPNPYMLLVQEIQPSRRHELGAVTHVDGTGRLQSVTQRSNPVYHRLISEFERRTGVPVVLNTSFNVRGEPIVHRPEEAIADFVGSDMDALFLGDLLVEKP